MKAPFGYRCEDGHLFPDPGEAPVRRRVYELFAEYGRLKTVARLLNNAGHRTRMGPFTDTTMKRLIRDTTARGVHPKVGSVEPIVSDELWHVCNRILDARGTEGTTVTRRSTHLFAGLAFCACGTRLLGRGRPARYTCQSCAIRVTEADLVQVLGSALGSAGFLGAWGVTHGVFLKKTWTLLDPNARRTLIEAVCHRIVVGSGAVEVTFYALTHSAEGNPGATEDLLSSCSGLEEE